MRNLIAAGSGLAVGAAVAAALAHAGSPPAAGRCAPAVPHRVEAPRPGGRTADASVDERDFALAWTEALRLAAQVRSLEALLDAVRADDDPRGRISAAIAGMGARELEAGIRAAIGLSDHELAAIGDVRAFAERLAEIAMEGILLPASSPSTSRQGEAGVVHFTSEPLLHEPAERARSLFAPDAGRIHAVFPSGDLGDRVLLRWIQVDPPRILLMQRYRIDPRDTFGYVWFEPDGEWATGRYQVEVYSADDAMERIAMGGFEVR